MNQEKIIRMAQEADGHMNSHAGGIDMTWKGLERFAAFVAAAAKAEEREACAKVCEDDFGNGALNLAAAIRARGETK